MNREIQKVKEAIRPLYSPTADITLNTNNTIAHQKQITIDSLNKPMLSASINITSNSINFKALDFKNLAQDSKEIKSINPGVQDKHEISLDPCRELNFDDVCDVDCVETTLESAHHPNNNTINTYKAINNANFLSSNIQDSLSKIQESDNDSDRFVFSNRVQQVISTGLKEKFDLKLDLSKIILQRDIMNK